MYSLIDIDIGINYIELLESHEIIRNLSFRDSIMCYNAIMRKLKLIILLLALGTSLSLMAQRERNYIYLLDCTKSMIGYNGSPNIWQSTKDYLKNELEKHTPGTTLHIIPF